MKDYEKNTYINGKPFGIFISSLGHYNEGTLTGKWLGLPATKEEVLDAYRAAGIGKKDEFGQVYESPFISDYDDYTHMGLADICGEYANVDALNLLAQVIEDMEDEQYNALVAYVDAESPCDIETLYETAKAIGSGDSDVRLFKEVNTNEDIGYLYTVNAGLPVEELDDLTKENYFDYEAYGEYIRDSHSEEELSFVDGINKSDRDLGLAWIEEFGFSEESLNDYFDFDAYGRDIRSDTMGVFTVNGYLEYPNGAFCDEGALEEDMAELRESNALVCPKMSTIEEIVKIQDKYKKPKRDAVKENKKAGEPVVQTPLSKNI